MTAKALDFPSTVSICMVHIRPRSVAEGGSDGCIEEGAEQREPHRTFNMVWLCWKSMLFLQDKGRGRLLDSRDEWCIGSDAGEMLMAVLWCCCHWFLVWWLLWWCCCGAVWCVICLHMSSVWHFWHSVDFSSSQSDRLTDYSLTTALSLLLTSSPIPTSSTPTTAYVFFEVVLFIYFVGVGFRLIHKMFQANS